MSTNIGRAGAMVAICLIITVVTQIFYVVALGGPSPFAERWGDIARPSVWMIELAVFCVLSVAAMTAMVRGAMAPAAWGAIALSGIFNAVQVSMGLSMFKILSEAGETVAPVFSAVLAGAFFFYFLAKVMVGMAGIGFGLSLFGNGSLAAKIAGVLAILTGFAASAGNIWALSQGMALTQMAGATGTVSALFTAIAAYMLVRSPVQNHANLAA